MTPPDYPPQPSASDTRRGAAEVGRSPTIDVILCTRNRGGLLSNTLDSLRAITPPPSHVGDGGPSDSPSGQRTADGGQRPPPSAFNIYIIDQSQNDDTARVAQPVCDQDPRFHLIRTPTQGLDVARNIGARAGSGEVIAYIDDDCRAAPGWIQGLLAEYVRDPQVWAVFGRTIPGQTAHAHTPANRFDQALPMAMVDYKQRRVFERNRFDLGFGHGANMSFARSTFARIGMFDELLGTGGKLRSWPERDFGYRILKAGGRIVYTPDALVHHDHWREWPEVLRTYRNYAIGCGAAVGKYLRKGDYAAILLLLEWVWGQGFRQMASGLLRWQSWEKFFIGWTQVIYPFVGLWMSRRYPISDHECVYESPYEQA